MKRNSIYFTLIPLAFLIAVSSVVFNNISGKIYSKEPPDLSEFSTNRSESKKNRTFQNVSVRIPERGKKCGDRWTVMHRGSAFNFRWCPPGSFLMGSSEKEKDRYENEVQHKVTLTKGFWILETEVTQKMFLAVTGKNPSEFRGDQKPVDTVSWQDCVNFCEELTRQFADSTALNLSAKDKKSLSGAYVIFTLPTEAQWEYACRAGTEGVFAGTLEKIAWFGEPNETGSTHPVGTKQPNAWGIFDMHGNLWEWCADWYRDFSKESETDPEGPKTSNCGVRIDRGGCWDSTPDYCRCAHRGTYEPDRAGRYVGFRIIVIR